jgi:hypothetical protein
MSRLKQRLIIANGRSALPRLNLDASAAAYFTAAGITNYFEQKAANDLIIALKAGSIWNRWDAVWLISRTSEAAARIDCKALTSLTVSGAATWSTNGYQIDSGTTNKLRTPSIMSSLSQFQQTDASVHAYFRSASASASGYFFGSNDGTLKVGLEKTDGTTNFQHRINDSVNSATSAQGVGLLSVVRTTNTAAFYARNGVAEADVSDTSTTRSNQALGIGAVWNGTAYSTPLECEVSALFVGGAISGVQLTNLYNIIQAYQTALGRNV